MAEAIVPRSAPQPDTRLTVTKILAATDFSPASDLALDYALALARRGDAQIYLAHVVPLELALRAEKFPGEAGPDKAWRAAERGMADILVSGKLRAIPHEVLLERGGVWPVLAKLIEMHEIDLIVTGTHAHSKLHRGAIGVIADEVFRHAACSVMTVGPRVLKDRNGGELGLRNILLATDFGPETERTAGYAFSLAQEHDARLTVLHVIQEAQTTGAEEQPLPATRSLAQLVPPGAENWREAECRASVGRVPREILAVARETDADLIVMGTQPRKASVEDTPFGIPYDVMAKAHCPVLTVRKKLQSHGA